MRREILQFLKELNVEEVREFASSKDFELECFASLLKKPEEPKEQKADLAEFSTEILTYLKATEFSKDKPFDGENITCEIDSSTLQINKASTAKIFNFIVTEMLANNMKFDAFCTNEFGPIFKSLVVKAMARDQNAVSLLGIKTKAKDIWLVEVKAKVDGKNILLTLNDKTQEYAFLLGKIKTPVASEEQTQKQKPIDVIIFRYTCLQTKDIKKWVTKTAALLNKAQLWPEGNRPRFIAVRYEDDSKEKAEFNHPFIDELICLPFDRLIFLQKVEIVLGLPKNTSPSFLFVQEADDPTEISKKVNLERISDLGFAMANPIPLAPGTLGHFYFRFPGQKPLLDIHGKVYNSTPHPEKEGQYLVYFNFFGLNKNMNKEIRAFLARDTAYRNLQDSDPGHFKYNPENIFLTEEQKQRKTVAILDIEEQSLKSLTDYFKKEVDHIDVVFDDSYFGFFKRYLDRKVDALKALPAKAEDFYAETVSIMIDSVSMNLQMPLTQASDTDLFLGLEAKKLFAEPQGWLRIFEGDARNLLTECLHLVITTRRVVKNFEIRTVNGELRTVCVEFIKEDTTNAARINFKIPDLKTMNKAGQLSRIESLDCVLIDYALLPDDINAFAISIEEACRNAGIKTPKGGIRIVVLASEGQNPNFDKLANANIFGMVYKPVEIRRVLYLATLAMGAPFTIYNFDNIGWKTDLISAKIARPAQLVELSEFGATIRSEQPLKPGTMVYLFKSIFANAPDQNLCVRVYASEENDADGGGYLNHVTYFGITDAFLKFTRSYIRETYASKKAKSS